MAESFENSLKQKIEDLLDKYGMTIHYEKAYYYDWSFVGFNGADIVLRDERFHNKYGEDAEFTLENFFEKIKITKKNAKIARLSMENHLSIRLQLYIKISKELNKGKRPATSALCDKMTIDNTIRLRRYTSENFVLDNIVYSPKTEKYRIIYYDFSDEAEPGALKETSISPERLNSLFFRELKQA